MQRGQYLTFGLLAGIFLGLGVLFGGVFLGRSVIYLRNFNRYVEVKGLAEEVVKSDQASWQVGFSTTGDDLKTIYNNLSTEQQEVIDFLKKQGFQDAEIQRQPISINDNYSYGNPGSSNAKMPRYNASSGINLNTGKVDLVNQAMQLTNQLVQAGVFMTNSNVNYQFVGLNSIKTRMLKAALANARSVADLFAERSNSTLGKIKQASQGLFTIEGVSGNSYDNSTVWKKVRIVTTVQYFLK